MLDAQENSTLTSDFDSLHTSVDSRPPSGLQSPAIPSITEAQNPWSEEQLKLDLKPAHTPDPAAINAASPSVFAAPADLINNALDHQVRVSKDVLTQFDPFTNEDELSAHQAWASSEGHPPPPRIPSRPSSRAHSRSASKDIQRDGPSSRSGSPSPQPSTSSASSAFPSLAAIARTFSIPSVATRARPRPLSMDAAKPIATPSPTTVSSFAQQQSQSTAPSPLSKQIPLPPDYAASKTQSAPDTRSATPAITSPSGSESPPKDKDPSFNFQKFLDQMKSRGAEPLGKYVRSFLSNFTKRTFTVNDQIKIINDFLSFIATKMRETDIWRNATEEEFDNAMEGMEKLVMNRLYEYTYTPCLPLLTPPRPVTADDLERDRVLSQRIALFSWVRPRHLDIPELESDDNDGNTGFLEFAQQELCKVNHYKAPRDKLICILNCCKIIFGLIRHLRKDEGADSFVPILIYVVLRANPEHLLSNVEFINRFRNPAKLQSEAGYYLSSLMGAVQFVESMDHTSLSSISQAEFERNVEAAIQTLPPSLPSSPTIAQGSQTPNQLPRQSPHAGEESAQPLALAVPSSSQNLTIGEDARKLLQKTGDVVSKPLGAISRIFSEALDEKMGYLPGPFAPFELGREERERHWSHPDQVAQFASGPPHTPTGSEGFQAPMQTPYKPRVRRTSPVPTPPTHMGYSYGADETPSRPGSRGPDVHQALALGPAQPLPPPNAIPQHLQPPSVGQHISRTPTPSLDLTAVEAEIDRAHAQASAAARATLAQIFPGVDPEVRDWVLEANGGDLGKSIEGLLDMAGGS